MYGGQYGRPPGYGGYGTPPAAAPGMAPPGMGPPPGVAAPGMLPPGMPGAPPVPVGRGASIPPNFQPPPGMNFNAPIIRLGTSGPPGPGGPGGRSGSNSEPMSAGGQGGGGNRRMGLGSGMDQRGPMSRDNMMALAQPTKEEIARTIFIGNITEGVGGDEGLERILRCAGSLRRWTRCTDADNKPCKFGFAEYEDAESLETAAEIFQNVKVPVKKPGKKPNSDAKPDTNGDVKMEDGEEESKKEEDASMEDGLEMTTLLVCVDDASRKYAEEWKSRRNESPETVQFRLDTARQELEGVLTSLMNPEESSGLDQAGDTTMQDLQMGANGNAEVVTIPISAEDELSDIPPEMREIVAAEIAAFRDRSNRRDMERLKREEEIEAAEKARAMGRRQPSPSRSGPAGGANGIPLGPRADRGLHGAPTGPRGMQGSQIPKDYQGGVSFVQGSSLFINRDDDDLSGSDSEIEAERKKKVDEEMEKKYLDEERRWLNRERTRTAALKREDDRTAAEKNNRERERERMAKYLAEFNDDSPAARKAEEYYADRGAWLRKRKAFREAEADSDRLDREAEKRETDWERQKQDQAGRMADDFLSRQAEEMERSQPAPSGPAPFKMSLTIGQKKAETKRRTAAEVENLLEDEEEEQVRAAKPRTIVPLLPSEISTMTEEERKEGAKQLAREIPTSTEDLAAWPVDWKNLDESIIEERLVPFVEKKVMEYLGIQEQMLVDLVERNIKEKVTLQNMIEEIEPALGGEAEELAKKLWRMIIFFSESKKRGLED